MVVLKTLARAVEDGDRIHGVIRGSAMNAGSDDAGLAVPSSAAQASVIRDALARAEVDPAQVHYVELHGTGTRVGDPVEADALGTVYGAGRPRGRALAVGSIKTNIGHLAGAAGIAGLIKGTLCLARRELVPSLNFASPNPRIAMEERRLRVVDAREPWPATAQPMLAGVSSFGVGGANAHAILEAAPLARAKRRSRKRKRGLEAVPLLVSGRDEAGISAQAARLREHLLAYPELELPDVAFSLVTTRTQFRERAAVVGRGRDELLAGLEALCQGEPAGSVVRGGTRMGKTVFVFPGQGSQWDGMAEGLLESSRVFAKSIHACDVALSRYVDWSVEDVLRGAPRAPSLDRLDVIHPVLFAMMVSLAALWRSYGVEPDAVVGHSLGEIAAAHVAGGLSLPDATRVVVLRSAGLAEKLSGHGGMVSIACAAEEVDGWLRSWDGQLAVSAVNGPSEVVVSGKPAALAELLELCEQKGVWARRVAVDCESHTAAVEVLREQLLDSLAPIKPRSGGVAFFSTAMGRTIDTRKLDAEYWYRALRTQVQFERATRALLQDGASAFLEISPHPILALAVKSTLADAGDVSRAAVVGSLRRGEGGFERFVTSLAEAHAGGVMVDWEAFFARSGTRRVDLPTYAFQRQRHWLAPSTGVSRELPSALGTDPGEVAEPGASALAGGGVSAVRREVRMGGGESLFAQRLSELPEGEWDATVLELVRDQAAAILGHPSANEVDPRLAFKELGFDSVAAMDLQARLVRVTGLSLPETLVFDNPSPAAVAAFLRARLDGEERGGTAARLAVRTGVEEVVAIVGMGCRYPGGVRSPRELWELVAEGREAIGDFPTDRGWDLEGLFDPDAERAGTSSTREGGFLHDVGEFDAGFFGIGPREALAMDPQQRLLLEVAWEALEDAGVDPSSLRASATGVFAGLSLQDYITLQNSDDDALEGLRLTGSLTSVISGRVAYALGLEGPAVSVDTACSSSLVALHLACQSIRQGECSLALAGGVTVMASPAMFTEFSRQRGLSADGRCRSFAAGADGVGWSEGVGLVVLEGLSDARRLGHRVLGVVRSSAVNQDGASNGLTAPNGPAQERVIAQALANAGLSPGDVDVVEGHGTGTRLGDPIEAQALLATYGTGREAGPLWLGSIKSNIGHTQAAAGVAGVIKMVMALEHGVLPKTLHAGEPSPHVDWSAGEVRLLSESAPWPSDGRPRRAGVSSFGISGTNAHVIIEEPPVEQVARRVRPRAQRDGAEQHPRSPVPIVPPLLVSASSESALRTQAERLRAHLLAHPELAPLDVAFTLASARAQLGHRAVVMGGEHETLLAGLEALARGELAGNVLEGVAAEGRTAFMFTGQGGQRPGMGRELYESFPVFRAALDEVCAELDRSRERPLLELVFAAEGSAEAVLLDRTEHTQAGLFALEVALLRLVGSLGLEPELLIGHSIGELVAAYVAGVFSLGDACKLVAARARLMGALPAGGAMLAVQASAREAAAEIAGREESLAIAAVNGPHAVVLAGASGAIEEQAARWRERGRKAKRLRVSHAFHTPLVEPMLAEFDAVAREIAYAPPQLAIASNVTGEIAGEELATPEYWVRHVREAVRFSDGIAALERAGATRFLELGPDGVLAALAPECLSATAQERALAVPALRAGRSEVEALLAFLAQAHVAGAPLDWKPLFAERDPSVVGLPTYAFQRERYWLTSRPGVGDVAAAGLGAVEHPLLGAAVRLARGEGWLFTGRLSLESHPWLADHAVLDTVLLPGTAFLELALSVGRMVGCETLDELTLQAPLLLGEQGAVQLQIALGDPDESGRRELAFYSHAQHAAAEEAGKESEWVLHAEGVLAPDLGTGRELDLDLRWRDAGVWPPEGSEEVDVELLYDGLAEKGFSYGPAFQGVQAAWRRGGELFAEVALQAEQAHEAARFAIHPALLDAALHGGLPGWEESSRLAGPPLPFSFSGVRLRGEGRPRCASP